MLQDGGCSSSKQRRCGDRRYGANRERAVDVLHGVAMIYGAREADDALGTVFRAHGASLVGLAFALTGDRGVAEELAQDAFVALARQTRSPRAGAELAYLRRTVVNLTHDQHRHLRVVRRQPDLSPQSEPAAETAAERRHVQQRVANAVRALPLRQRDCMVLRCYSEATDAEIASTLGLSTGTVKKHLHRARATLATQLGDLR